MASAQICKSAVSCSARNLHFQERRAAVPSVSWRAKSLSFSSGVSSVEYLNSANLLSKHGGAGQGVAVRAVRFPFLGQKNRDITETKIELFSAIAPLDRGASETPADAEKVEQIVQKLEKLNPTEEPLTSPLLNGRWRLVYTTSDSTLKKSRPKILRPNGPIFQSINTDTLRAENMETWPFFNQVTANLEPVDGKKLVVKFDNFKIGGLCLFSSYRHMDLAIGASHHAATKCLMDTFFHDCLSVVGGDFKEPSKEDSNILDNDQNSERSLDMSKITLYSCHFKWCGLCGSGNGKMICGRCMGGGGYPTRPCLAGVRGSVGWARCKTCFGNKTLPCLLCNPKN